MKSLSAESGTQWGTAVPPMKSRFKKRHFFHKVGGDSLSNKTGGFSPTKRHKKMQEHLALDGFVFILSFLRFEATPRLASAIISLKKKERDPIPSERRTTPLPFGKWLFALRRELEWFFVPSRKGKRPFPAPPRLISNQSKVII